MAFNQLSNMDKIQIKCTSCGQKFPVTESYIGRMVECGACDEKFKVEGSAIVTLKKHYPGEKSESNTEVYAKSPSTEPSEAQDVTFQTASYQNVSAEYAQPTRPLKTLMICIGAIFMLLIIVIFLIGGREDGILKGLDNTKRLILTGFVALMGSSLIIAGSRHKIKGLLLSLVLGGSLIAMPFVFPEVIEAILADKPLVDPSLLVSTDDDANKNTFSAQLEKYKRDIGFSKVEASRIALNDPDSLKVLVLRQSKIQDLDAILTYLKYTLAINTPPNVYASGREINSQPVTLITFITEAPMERVFEVTKKFGLPQEMDEIRTALKIIEVVVDRSSLKGQPSEFTNDTTHPNYFDANYAELRNIDRAKQLDAARRLQSANIKGRQADIVSALCELINSNDHELSRQAIATLNYWTLPEYKTDQRVLDYAKEVVATDFMHRSVMDYLADKDVPGSEEILAKQWAASKGYLLWENYLVRAKKRGEKAVISALPTLDQTHFKSAASILSKVGTAESIPAINAVLSRVNENDKKYFKAAIDEIKSRQ
ncbi:MAG: hypothetical protein ACI9E1_000479 [Cryomorphaceae bacterium]|jgi:hypothetical protein